MDDRNTNYEPAQGPPPAQHRTRAGGLIWAALFVGGGIVLLLNNFGLLGWGVWIEIARLWPVLLIAAGIAIIFGRRTLIGGALAALLVLATIGAGVGLYVYGPSNGYFGTGNGQVLTSETIDQPTQGATSANIVIRATVSSLTINDMSDNGKLITGKVSILQGERVTSNYSVDSGVGNYTLGSEGPQDIGNFFNINGRRIERNWNFSINRNIPTSLSVNTGVGVANINLSHLKLTNLDINTGVGNSTMIMPSSGDFQARVERGVGNVVIQIPSNMAARIRLDNGLGNNNVTGNYNRNGTEYVSPNFDTSTNRIDLQVTGGVGNCSIEPAPAQ